MADADENLELSLTCAICLDIAGFDNAVETTCCHSLFCSTCVENVHPCPSCRKESFQTVPAHFARRLIGNMKVLCPNDGCKSKITRSNLPDHLKIHCRYRPIVCPDPQCEGFKCGRKDFVQHLIDKHERHLLDNIEKLWRKDKITEGRGIVFAPEENRSVRVSGSAKNVSRPIDDRIETNRNILGRNARLGSTGKFYCNGKLDGNRCSCCNGRCGPSNGCNCSGCMLLDIDKRQLPSGWFVNREGASARCSDVAPGIFYCGRMVMLNDPTTDGYCGPTNGAQCEACQKLNEQRSTRYVNIWSNQSSS